MKAERQNQEEHSAPPLVQLSESRELPFDRVLRLYQANGWSAAHKAEQLYQSLIHSHALVSAWIQQDLIGLGNTLSDGYLTVYFSHLLVLPAYQRQGIGSRILKQLLIKYED